MKLLAFVFVLALVVSGFALGVGAPLALLFGWVIFLGQTVPRMTVYWPSVGVGVVALGLFVLGVQRVGRSWRRDAPTPWRWRTSLTVVTGICMLFAAGIALVGLVHQSIWLATAEKPLVQEVVEPRFGGNSRVNLHMLGTALGNSLASAPSSEDAGPASSWALPMLPYMGYFTRDYHPNLPWNDPHNARVARSVIPGLLNPELSVTSVQDENGFGVSHYAGNSHVFRAARPLRPDTLSNGAAQLLLVGEVNANFKAWASPYNCRDPLLGINRSPHGFGGPVGKGGALFVLGDGSVRFVGTQTSPTVLRALSVPKAATLENPHPK